MRVNCPDIDAKSLLYADFKQCLFKHCARQPAQMPQRDPAVAVKHDRIRQRAARIAELPGQGMRGALADQDWIIDRQALQELRDVGRIVDCDADKFHAFGSILRSQGDEIRNFLATGRAPAGPEIQDDDLSAPLRQRLFMTLAIWKIELPQPG